MPDPDPIRAFQDAAKMVQSAFDGIAKQSGLPSALSDLGLSIQPLFDSVILMGRIPEMLRAQATAFEGAAASLADAAKILHTQADLMEQAVATVKIPHRVVRRTSSTKKKK